MYSKQTINMMISIAAVNIVAADPCSCKWLNDSMESYDQTNILYPRKYAIHNSVAHEICTPKSPQLFCLPAISVRIATRQNQWTGQLGTIYALLVVAPSRAVRHC